MRRKKYCEDGASADFADDIEETAVALYDALHGGEAKACAFARLFCGEKRLENLFQDVGLNAVAGIGNGNRDVGTGNGLGLQGRDFIFQRRIFGR